MDFNISQPEITEAIYRTILAAYTESPVPDLPPAHQNCKLFINYVWPGKILNETVYQNPWTPNNRNGSQIVTENISNLVNPIPLLDTAYTQSGSQVENLYEFILMASPSTGESTKVPRTLMKRAKSDRQALNRVEVGGPKNNILKKILDYGPGDLSKQDLERQYANASANFIANHLQYNLSDPIEKKEWEKIAPKLEAVVRSSWELVSNNIPKAKFILKSNENPVYYVLDSANKIFASTRLSSTIDPTFTYHPSYVSPDNFAYPETASVWPFIPSIKVTTSGSTKPNLSISFRFCRVDIRRPWLLMNLLEIQGWKIQDQPAGSLSNGKAKNNSGSFPLLPEFFVVARDLVISGIGENSGEEYYSAKGLQILAWINRVTPFIPPNA